MKDLPEKLSPLLGDASEHQEDIERIYGVKMPTVHLYEGFSRGPRATKDRCTICHRLIGHKCFVVVDGEGLANARCYAQREAERRVEKRDIAKDKVMGEEWTLCMVDGSKWGVCAPDSQTLICDSGREEEMAKIALIHNALLSRCEHLERMLEAAIQECMRHICPHGKAAVHSDCHKCWSDYLDKRAKEGEGK